MLRITNFIIIMISLLTTLISTCFGRYGNYVGVLLHKDNIQWSQRVYNYGLDSTKVQRILEWAGH